MQKDFTLRNTWFEEEYESLLSIARIKLALNNLPEYGYKFTFEEIEQDFLTAINTCNGRAEPTIKKSYFFAIFKYF